MDAVTAALTRRLTALEAATAAQRRRPERVLAQSRQALAASRQLLGTHPALDRRARASGAVHG